MDGEDRPDRVGGVTRPVWNEKLDRSGVEGGELGSDGGGYWIGRLSLIWLGGFEGSCWVGSGITGGFETRGKCPKRCCPRRCLHRKNRLVDAIPIRTPRTRLPKPVPIAALVNVLWGTALGDRQSGEPRPPVRMGPTDHINPSELANEAKKENPSGSATVQLIAFIFVDVMFTGGCKLGAIVSAKGGAPLCGRMEKSEH